MNRKSLITLLGLSMLLAACASSGNAQTPALEVIPTVVADTAIIAEGHLEPIHYAEIAFNTSGLVNEVLVHEGEPIQKGEPLIRLGDESDSNYAVAQLELVAAQQALNDLLNSSDFDLAQTIIDLKEAKEDYARRRIIYITCKPSREYRKSIPT